MADDWSAHDHLGQARFGGRGFVVLGAGGGGLGDATCQALAAAGAKLLCVDRSAAEAERIAALTGGMPCTIDATDRAQMEILFAQAHGHFGTGFAGIVDIIGMARIASISEFDDAAIADQFAIVLRHALLAVQIGAPLLAENGGGAIVLVGSLSGSAAIRGQAIYGMAKAALHHLVRFAAQEFGPAGVRVNAVAPSFVETPRLKAAIPQAAWDRIAQANPLRRAARPDDIAKAILFLAGALSSYVNGVVLPLDGGISATAELPGLDALAAPSIPSPARPGG